LPKTPPVPHLLRGQSPHKCFLQYLAPPLTPVTGTAPTVFWLESSTPHSNFTPIHPLEEGNSSWAVPFPDPLRPRTQASPYHSLFLKNFYDVFRQLKSFFSPFQSLPDPLTLFRVITTKFGFPLTPFLPPGPPGEQAPPLDLFLSLIKPLVSDGFSRSAFSLLG